MVVDASLESGFVPVFHLHFAYVAFDGFVVIDTPFVVVEVGGVSGGNLRVEQSFVRDVELSQLRFGVGYRRGDVVFVVVVF